MDFKELKILRNIFSKQLELANNNLVKCKESEALNFGNFIQDNEIYLTWVKQKDEYYSEFIFDIKNQKP
jgi:hypothetical protein